MPKINNGSTNAGKKVRKQHTKQSRKRRKPVPPISSTAGKGIHGDSTNHENKISDKPAPITEPARSVLRWAITTLIALGTLVAAAVMAHRYGEQNLLLRQQQAPFVTLSEITIKKPPVADRPFEADLTFANSGGPGQDFGLESHPEISLVDTCNGDRLDPLVVSPDIPGRHPIAAHGGTIHLTLKMDTMPKAWVEPWAAGSAYIQMRGTTGVSDLLGNREAPEQFCEWIAQKEDGIRRIACTYRETPSPERAIPQLPVPTLQNRS
jgi:hypothetical protein